ncbi:TonB-dependent receptor [Aestuariibacter sp. A3R04]|uniref:TonB-dependent receptor n=1 Tax=Aestuariibacter sp. A3R04 TaxID=2841571 RepID=UPI0020913CDC|nr:TonB-dependent receptor [Aestuariibacter sp. A3R04]
MVFAPHQYLMCLRLVALVIAALGLVLSPRVAATTHESVVLHIDGQSLTDSLRFLSVKYNQPFVVNQALTGGIRVPELSGKYTLEEALDILLANTSLVYHLTPEGILLKPVAINKSEQSIIEEVAVTGIRASLDISRQRKRESQVISDVIAARDIATYPDRNLAESMQRIPGMSIAREAGEGRQIMLRGLNPDFTLVTLNGMPVLANNDSPMDSRQQRHRDRSFDLNLFATELFSNIQVLKSYQASQPTGGLAGIAALETAHPFDHPGLNWHVNTQTGKNTYIDEPSARFSTMVSSTKDHWGALVSMSYGERRSQEVGANTFRWRQITPEGADISPLPEPLASAWQAGELYVPRGNRYSVWQSDMTRAGVSASLEYLSDRHHITLDWLFGEFSGERHEYHLYPRGYRSTPVIEGKTTIADAQVNENNELVFGVYQRAQVGTESRFQRVSTLYRQWVLNAEHQWTPKIEGHLRLGWEKSDYAIPVGIKAYMESATDVTIDYRDEDGFARISYADDLTERNFWYMKELDAEQYFASTGFANANYDVKLILNTQWQWRAGFDLVHFNSETHLFNVQDMLADEWALFRQGMPAQSTDERGVMSLNDKVPDSVGNTLTAHPRLEWMRLNPTDVFHYYGLPSHPDGIRYTSAAMRKPWTLSQDRIGEQRYALFSEVDFRHGPLRINGGVRIEQERIDVWANDFGIQRAQELEYTSFLPALNLRYDTSHTNVYRVALSRTIGRPLLSDLARTVEYDEEKGVLFGFNPSLGPYTATNLDIAWESYLTEMNRISLSVFYKYLDDYIVMSSEQLPLAHIPEQDIVEAVAGDRASLLRVVPENAEGAALYGVELSTQFELPLTGLPGYHVGVAANASYTQGEVRYYNSNNGQALTKKSLPYLSPWLANVTAYWEGYAMSLRMSATYRDAYLARVDGNTLIDEDETGFESSIYVDAVAAYQIDEHWELRAEAVNLTNERERQYSDSSHRPYNTTLSGRNFYLGVTYRH